MKNLILIIGLLIGFSSMSYAQCKKSCKSSCGKGVGMQVPFSAKDSFKKKHPDAMQVKWKRESGNYEACYKKDNKEVSVLINKNGKILEEEYEIDVQDLPSAAAKYIKKKYKKATIKEAEKVVKDGKTYYEVDLDDKGKEVELRFDEDGNILED